MTAKSKKKRGNSLEDLQKVFALMFGLGLSLDTIEKVLIIIEDAIVEDVEVAKVVISDLAILLSGRLPKGERDSVVGSFVITALLVIANDFEKEDCKMFSKKVKQNGTKKI